MCRYICIRKEEKIEYNDKAETTSLSSHDVLCRLRSQARVLRSPIKNVQIESNYTDHNNAVGKARASGTHPI